VVEANEEEATMTTKAKRTPKRVIRFPADRYEYKWRMLIFSSKDSPYPHAPHR